MCIRRLLCRGIPAKISFMLVIYRSIHFLTCVVLPETSMFSGNVLRQSCYGNIQRSFFRALFGLYLLLRRTRSLKYPGNQQYNNNASQFQLMSSGYLALEKPWDYGLWKDIREITSVKSTILFPHPNEYTQYKSCFSSMHGVPYYYTT